MGEEVWLGDEVGIVSNNLILSLGLRGLGLNMFSVSSSGIIINSVGHSVSKGRCL